MWEACRSVGRIFRECVCLFCSVCFSFFFAFFDDCFFLLKIEPAGGLKADTRRSLISTNLDDIFVRLTRDVINERGNQMIEIHPSLSDWRTATTYVRNRLKMTGKQRCDYIVNISVPLSCCQTEINGRESELSTTWVCIRLIPVRLRTENMIFSSLRVCVHSSSSSIFFFWATRKGIVVLVGKKEHSYNTPCVCVLFFGEGRDEEKEKARRRLVP